MVFVILHPLCFEYGANGGFVVSAGFFETGEVVSAEQALRCEVHLVYVQLRPAAQVRVLACKRVFCAVDVVSVFPALGVEPCVKIGGCLFYAVNHNCIWQDGIDFVT